LVSSTPISAIPIPMCNSLPILICINTTFVYLNKRTLSYFLIIYLFSIKVQSSKKLLSFSILKLLTQIHRKIFLDPLTYLVFPIHSQLQKKKKRSQHHQIPTSTYLDHRKLWKKKKVSTIYTTWLLTFA
jgi:hypothetical protein